MCKNLFNLLRLTLFGVVFIPFFHGCQTLDSRPAEPSPAATPPAAESKAPAAAKPAKSSASRPAKPTPAVAEACGVKLTQSREELAQSYYVKGERLFNDDNIGSAKQALHTSVCLNPKHKQALELLDLLQKTYPSR